LSPGRVLLDSTFNRASLERVAVTRRPPSPSQGAPPRRRTSTRSAGSPRFARWRAPPRRQRRDYEGSRRSSSGSTADEDSNPRRSLVQVSRRNPSDRIAETVDVGDAGSPVDVEEQPGHAAPLGRMRPKRARRATELLPRQQRASGNRPLFVRGPSRFCACFCAARAAFPRPFAVFLSSGGGGNRTRVRNRTGKSVYKRSLRLSFARRPVRRRPTDGLALLWCPALGEWLSLRG